MPIMGTAFTNVPSPTTKNNVCFQTREKRNIRSPHPPTRGYITRRMVVRRDLRRFFIDDFIVRDRSSSLQMSQQQQQNILTGDIDVAANGLPIQKDVNQI